VTQSVSRHQSADSALATAFEAYLTTDEGHRRGPAEALLRLSGARDFAVDRLAKLGLHSVDARRAIWRLAVFDAIGRMAEGGQEWMETAVAWLDLGGATWQESAGGCAEVGFQAYLADKPDMISLSVIKGRDPLSVAGRALLHLHLVALRLAYRWEDMEQCLTSLDATIQELDPYSRAYHVFALLAENHPDGQAEMNALLDVAEDDYRVTLSLVEGLRLSRGVPDQAEQMLRLLSGPAMTRSTSPDPLYRKAFALRKLGRYEEALRVVDECLQRISPLQVRDRVRIVQERDLILAEQTIREQAEAARRAADDQVRAAAHELEQLVAGQIAEMRQTMTDGLVRVVEILGVFTAIIAVLGGGAASIVTKGLLWWQRGVLILIAGVVAIGFFALLRIMVQPRRAKPERQRSIR
jgi:tetratricopeptide (TPR) repeat protein